MRLPSAREFIADAVVHALGLGLGVVGVVAILVVVLDGPTSGRLLPRRHSHTKYGHDEEHWEPTPS